MAAPAPTLTPNSKKEQDEAHNPFQQDADTQFNNATSGYKSTADELKELEDYANNSSGVDDIERYANDPANATKERQDVKDKEESAPNDINYTGSGNQEPGKKQKFSFKPGEWKKGPMGVIVAIILGGGGLMGGMSLPALGPVQLKETMLKSLNDQVAAMTEADTHLLRTKLKTMQAGFSVCSKAVSIRCKFSTLSKREVKRLKDAGFTIEPDNGDARTKPTKIIFPSEQPNGGGPRKEATNPQEMRDVTKGNIKAQSALLKGYNPKFGGITDKVANAMLGKLHIDKRSKLTPGNPEDMEKQLGEAAQGLAGELDSKGYKTDKDGRNYVLDDKGNKVFESGEGSDAAKFAEIRDQNLAFIGDIRDQMADAEPGRSAVGSMLGSVGRGLRITGALDTACTVYNAARALAAAAKVARALQLAQFAATLDTEADKIKAGKGDEETASFLGSAMGAADLQKTIRDENTITGVDSDGNPIYAEAPNPHYMKTAYDSKGYKLAAYDNPLDAGPLDSREQQFTIGGGLTGTLTGVLDTITTTLGLGNDAAGRAAIQGVCSVVQSWWMRTIGLVGGIISGIGSFGATTAISVGASVAIGFALPFLKAALADTLAGKVVSGKTKGMDMGNASFAGNGEVLGKMAAARGLKPANLTTQKAYQLVANRVNDEYVAVETYEARATPFDVMNQYSFLGSLVRTINPIAVKSSASLSGALISVPTLIGTAFNGLIPFAHAAEVFNAERYKQCADLGYEMLGINADAFCNVRFILTDKQLGMLSDPDAIAVWMENNGHIDDEGNAKSDAYNRWLKACTQRDDGWGETANDEPEDYDAESGKICMEESTDNDYFAVFTLLKTSQESRETAPDNNSESAWWSESSIGSEDEGADL